MPEALTLQDMIDACPEGGVVTVPPGTYAGRLIIERTGITIQPAEGHWLHFGPDGIRCIPEQKWICPECGRELPEHA